MIMGRSSPSNEGTLAFIVTSPGRRSLEGKRKLIRSQAMRGRNRKKHPSRPSSWMDSQVMREPNSQEHNETLVPAKVGSDFAFVMPSGSITTDMLEAIWRLKWAMSPLDLDLAADKSPATWLEPICNDAACFHFTMFIARIYSDFVTHGQRKGNQMALSHFVTSLSILQQRLADADENSFTSDTTILVVVGLAMAATGMGELDVARQHLQGLYKMVMLRGGMMALRGKRQLQAKICRADLGVTLSTGCAPLFFSANISWDSYIAQGTRISVCGHNVSRPAEAPLALDLECFLDNLDTRLRLVWDDLAELSRSINVAAQSKRVLDVELYQEVTVSIHYRLVKLHFAEGNTNETIRLGLLAFASTLFLQWRSVKIRYEYLARRFYHAMSLLKDGHADMPPQLTLWLHTIGIIWVFDEREQALTRPTLARTLKSLTLATFREARTVLKSVLWVDGLHDAPTKQIVGTLISGSQK